ncbi:MAG: glycosyltransferase family 1 protein [Planctomycetota bacterium]|nr:MAG: glycosyltransferase family 1 protein [Planctomycetota bacterium]REK25817.1 MAG: glycosyltransferase family 1 protein [Planctomycetota bacterium]REK49488.1 MAG: glycosyltransferase family 1 protein [Planctomycetota bacterium]
MLYHYCPFTYATWGPVNGLARFDHELRRALPEIVTLTRRNDVVNLSPDDNDKVVITGNGYCLDVPDAIKCICVHHDIAVYERDRVFVALQQIGQKRGATPILPDRLPSRSDRNMQIKDRPNTIFVAPSTFALEAFRSCYGIGEHFLIPHAVDLPAQEHCRSRVVLGDWRGMNKGLHFIPALAEKGNYEFRFLRCGAHDKSQAYAEASIYLTISATEGGNYAALDALASGLRVVATDVGVFYGDLDASDYGACISWQERSNVRLILDKLDEVYDRYDQFQPRQVIEHDEWCRRWWSLVDAVRIWPGGDAPIATDELVPV